MSAKKKELLLGVIGTGGRAALAVDAHKPENGVRIVAAADVRPEAMKSFQERYPQLTDLFLTTDYRKLLKRPEIGAVFITSSDFAHEEHAVAALRAGKAVYLEKPMAISLAGCDRILAAAYENKARLYLGHNMRLMLFVRKMRQIIQDGGIGEVKTAWCRHFIGYGADAYYKDWHAEKKYAFSLLLQKGAHDIDILHWLCGGYTKRVVGMGSLMVYDKVKSRYKRGQTGDTSWKLDNWPPLSQTKLNPDLDVEDVNMMMMELDNGVLCSYEQCHFAPDAWRNYTIIGTEGRIENYGDYHGQCSIKVWNKRTSGYLPWHEEYDVTPRGGSHGGADVNIVDEFVRYVRGECKMTTSPVAARYSVAAGYLAAKSMRGGNRPQVIPDVPEEIARYFGRQTAK